MCCISEQLATRRGMTSSLHLVRFGYVFVGLSSRIVGIARVEHIQDVFGSGRLVSLIFSMTSAQS